MITRGQENCLFVFSADEFARVSERIREAPLTSKQARDYLRVFLSGASDEVPDKQGRVTLPQILREYANLDRDLVIIGVGSRAEIWDAKAWNRYLTSTEKDFAATAEEVIPGLF